MVPGSMVHGAWCMVHGAWSIERSPARASGPEFADRRGSGGGWNRTLNRVLLQSGNIIEEMKDQMQSMQYNEVQCNAEVHEGKGEPVGACVSDGTERLT